MTKLLVTGGAGFIGANFVRYWQKRHPDDLIVVLDALTYAGNRASLEGAEKADGFHFVEGDIRDQALVVELLRTHEIDTLVHFAAESHVDRSIHGPDVFIDTNVGGTHSLLKAAREVWLDAGTGRSHRFHHVSTDEVYGSLGWDDPAFSETTPYAPNSPYSASKAASDHLVRAYHHTYGLQVTTTNCSNNYGPYQFPEKLLPLFFLNALHGKALPVYGDGKNVRDWLHVEDHVSGIEAVLQRGRVGEVYNIGGECELSNLEVVERLCECVDAAFAADAGLAERFPNAPAASGGETVSLRAFVEDRAGHDRRYAIDTGKISAELGFRPGRGLAEGLRGTLAWYLANEAWWRAVQDGSYRDWIARNYEAR